MQEKLIEQFLEVYNIQNKNPKDVLRQLILHNILNLKTIRNILIATQYYSLLTKNGNKSYDAIYSVCSDWNISEKTVQQIIYKKLPERKIVKILGK